MTAATLTARQTLRANESGTREIADSWSVSMIPASWVKVGVLVRYNRGCRKPERFAFYKLPDGRVAKIGYHPMSGPDDLFVMIGTADDMRASWADLLAGERYEQFTDHGYGQTTVKRGRYAKARRVA